MFILTSAVGGSLALESSYLAVTLASHVGLALVTVGLCAYARAVVSRPYKSHAKAVVQLAGLSAGVAFLGGVVFLVGGQSDYALDVMTGFALLGMVASVLVIVLGGPAERLAAPADRLDRGRSSPPTKV